MTLSTRFRYIYELLKPLAIGIMIVIPILLLTPKFDTPAWVSALVLTMPLALVVLMLNVFGNEIAVIRRRVARQERLDNDGPSNGDKWIFGMVLLDDGDDFAARVEVELEVLPRREGSETPERCAEKERHRFVRPFTLIHPNGERVRIEPNGAAPSKVEALPLGPLVKASGRLFRIAEIVNGDLVAVKGIVVAESAPGSDYRSSSQHWVLRAHEGELRVCGHSIVVERRRERNSITGCVFSQLPAVLVGVVAIGFAFADMVQGLPHRVVLAAVAATVLVFAGAVPVRLALNDVPWFARRTLLRQSSAASSVPSSEILALQSGAPTSKRIDLTH